ncbi:MAG: hypothetical protein DCC55_28805, partial [Chloroflexi bacterium]
VYELFWRGVVDESAVEPADIGPLDITGAGGVVSAEGILMRASTLLDANFQTVDGARGGGIDDILLDAANGHMELRHSPFPLVPLFGIRQVNCV